MMTRTWSPRAARNGARTRARRTERRGAVVLLVGIMMVALMTVAAITIEAGRLYEAKSELQTAADAASLAGAIELLRRAPEAEDSARAFGSQNSAGNAKVTDMVVTTGIWSATTSTFAPALPLSADAVRVTARQSIKVFFAGLLGDSAITMSATAVAWSSAPVVETTCVKPWALPYEVVRNILSPSGPSLTDDDIRRLDDMSQNNEAATRFGVKFGQSLAADSTALGATDRYYAMDMPPTWQSATGSSQSVPSDPSGLDYALNVHRCNPAQVGMGDSLRAAPDSARLPLTISTVRNLCSAFVGDVCYGSGGQPGVMVKAVFFDGAPNWNGSGTAASIGVKLVGSFSIDSMRTSGPNTGELFGRLRTMRDYGKIGKTPTSLRRAVLVQ